MIRSKFAKSIIVGMCITAFSTGMAFADIGIAESTLAQNQQVEVESNLIHKQKEIDQYVEKHAEEIDDKGFKVTHTGPKDNFVEIGITPYNETSAEYFYEIFGEDEVRVVEGQQAVLMTTTVSSPDSTVSSPELDVVSVNDDVIKKQKEIDQYLFEQHKDEIAKKDFKVTHTAPIDNYVEIGITPYNKTNAEYLYEIFGKDMVKVVEGQQAVTLDMKAENVNEAELYAEDNTKSEVEEVAEKDSSKLAILIAGLVIVLSSVGILRKRKK